MLLIFSKNEYSLNFETEMDGYFFRANGRQYIQVKAKNPKTAKYLKCKLTWENEKSI